MAGNGKNFLKKFWNLIKSIVYLFIIKNKKFKK